MTEIIAYRNPLEAWAWQHADYTYFVWVVIFGMAFGFSAYLIDVLWRTAFTQKYYSGLCFLGAALMLTPIIWWLS